MSTIMNIDPWGFLDELLDTSNRTFRAMRARAAGRFPPVNVSIDDKPGNDGRSFKLWDARGHELSWTFTTTQPATFALQLRLCHAHTLVSRALAVDGKPAPDASTALPLPATGGWSSKADNWRNVWLATPTPDAKPVLLNLQPGTHTLTLTNTDGLGLNLDWLRLVPCRNR